MSANVLAGLAGIVLSLLFSYIPKLNAKFAALAPEVKRLIMLGLLALVAGGVYGISCSGWWVAVTCDQAGIKQLVEAFIAAIIANQSVYSITPQTPAVRTAKENRS